MSKTIVLAVDAQHDAPEAVQAAWEFCGVGDRIVVLHIHEFAVGRFGRLQVDCAAGEGEHIVTRLAASLRESGALADYEIREASVGHVPGPSWPQPTTSGRLSSSSARPGGLISR